mmetsp:Transcript_6122/g.5525  ORF Transcript_6122/g.5525 Transcript_6122/m.5525 type:complete len:107 (-) Transcript_6122:477-797(-)
MGSNKEDNFNSNGMMKLNLYNIYSLLCSNNLKVETEDGVLVFLHNYLLKFGESKPHSTMYCANMLSHCLRYSFISFHHELSVLRDNKYMKKSAVFLKKIRDELLIR